MSNIKHTVQFMVIVLTAIFTSREIKTLYLKSVIYLKQLKVLKFGVILVAFSAITTTLIDFHDPRVSSGYGKIL